MRTERKRNGSSGGSECMKRAHDKILTMEELVETVRRLQGAQQRVALCHGCFDILHCGHLRHLEAAKAMADFLVVTVTPDLFVNKGPDRPVFREEQRAELLAGLHVVDWVCVNRWKSALETILMLRPNLFVKGEEYESRAEQVNPNFFAEAKAVEEAGGKVAFTRELTLSSTAAFQCLSLVPK